MRIALGLLLLFTVACDDAEPAPGAPDATVADAALDGALPDAALDGVRPDAGPRDAAPPDAARPDAAPPDASPLDASPPDASPPDASPADAAPADAEVADAAPPDAAPAHRVVLAGDSWSSGLIGPTRDALDARGFDAVPLTFEFTANAGSTARGWTENAAGVSGRPMLDALREALDADPPATVLILVIGGNDLNREAAEDLGELSERRQAAVFEAIERDIESLVRTALDGRPDLRVSLVGYDFLHYDFLAAIGLSLDGFAQRSYNEAFVRLGRHKRTIAARHPQVVYAHNFGILQHTFGDGLHPPLPIPNPLIGLPAYAPGEAPAPGAAPDYMPYPGGLIEYPAPLDHMPDGIHPSAGGFRVIIENTLDQGPAAWLSAP